jgi:cytochrome P450
MIRKCSWYFGSYGVGRSVKDGVAESARFDPLRFTDEAIAARHTYAFIAFGGGARMCLGSRFAYMQAKCFTRHLPSTSVVSAHPNYKPRWKY